MKDNPHTLPSDVEENKLGLTNIDDINYMEAIGIAEAKAYSFNLPSDVKIDINLLRNLHKIAFGRLYHWAGKFRTTITNIGIPPFQIQERLKVYLDNLDYRLKLIDTENEDEVVSLLAEVHYTIVFIHPFQNGNGRIARLFTNLISLKLMYPPFEIYVRENSDDRKTYIDAIRKADEGNFSALKELVKNAIHFSIRQFKKMNGDTTFE